LNTVVKGIATVLERPRVYSLTAKATLALMKEDHSGKIIFIFQDYTGLAAAFDMP
jgi:hypothetical protein